MVGAAPRPQAGEICLGACVRVSLSGGHSRSQMTEEGVVIEVVEADAEVQSARVGYRIPIAEQQRYVVQCWSRRVLRGAAHILVVSL